jgi:hypothetical protein
LADGEDRRIIALGMGPTNQSQSGSITTSSISSAAAPRKPPAPRSRRHIVSFVLHQVADFEVNRAMIGNDVKCRSAFDHACMDRRVPGDYLPPYFDNLLPEGALLELVEREFGTGLSSV